MKLKHLSLSVMMMGASAAAMASGYHFGTQSVSAQSTANANGAEANDASTIFYNPAGMTKLEGTNFSGVLNVVVPHVEFANNGSSTAAGVAIKGGNGGKIVDPAAVPHVYVTHQLNDKLTAGLGIFVPFGSKTSYDRDWVGRYNIIETELKTITFNPSLAFKLTEKVSVGVGISAQHIEGKLVKGVDSGTSLVNAAKAAGGMTTAAHLAAAGQISGNAALDGTVDVNGDDWGFGYNFGVLYDINEQTRVGLAYRSAIEHTLKGDAKWALKPSDATATINALTSLGVAAGNLAATAGALATQKAAITNSNASLKVKTPDSLSLNFFHSLNDRWDIMGDYTRTFHSKFQELRIDFDNTLPDSITPEKWKDTDRISLGVANKYSDRLKLRAGVAYDETPVANESLRTPSIPDNDRYWLSLGGNYALDKDRSVDFAYSFVKIKSSNTNNNDWCGGATVSSVTCTSSKATLKGSYKSYAQIIGVQYNQRF